MKKIIISAVMTTLLFTGCGGVDSQKLAQLTGDKTFDQVREAYTLSVLNEKPEDTEIYAYYFTKNEDKVVGFDFDNFALKVKSDHTELVSKLETTLQHFEKNIDKVSYSTLKNELLMGGFLSGTKPVDDYLKKIKKLISKKRQLDDAVRKAQR